jgi:hypothetical protein
MGRLTVGTKSAVRHRRLSSGELNESIIARAKALLTQSDFAGLQRELIRGYHDRGLHMEGRAYRMAGRPLLLERSEAAGLARTMRHLHEVVESVVDGYAKYEEVRELFAEYRDHESAILDYPPTSPRVQLCRFDCAWYGGSSFKIMETNTACPGGVVQIPMATRQWLESPWAAELLDGMTVVPYRMLGDPHAFTRALVSSASAAGYEVASAAVVNLRGVYTYELEWIVRSFLDLGIDAQQCDARSMRDVGGRVRAAGHEYELLYNKLDPLMLLEDAAAAEYLDMFRRRHAYFVNSLVAQTITEDKAVLAAMSDPRFEALFDVRQRELIREHVPWTRFMEEGMTLDPDGVSTDLFTYVASNRKRLVLKPANLTRGERVLVGPHVMDSDWQRGLAMARKDRYVAQEYTPLPRLDIPADSGTGFNTVNVDLSCYMLDGNLAGFFSRCSADPVVNLGHGGSCVPVVQVEQATSGPDVA